jgi:uncharacterized protein (TIGR03083 family)
MSPGEGWSMDPTTILAQARSAVADLSGKTADLVRGLPDLKAPLIGEWTVREGAVHLVTCAGFWSDMVNGLPSPLESFGQEAEAVDNARRIADIPEADPEKVARLITDSVERLLRDTEGLPGDHQVTYHAGVPADLDKMICIYVGELVLHGYDMALAVGAPWPIDPAHAQLVLYGYSPFYDKVLNEDRTRGLTAAYGIELRGGPGFIVRFVDGRYSLEPADSGPIDCTISADPVAFLMVLSGRLSRWPAISLDLISATGDVGMALGFPDLFVYP